MPNRDGTGPDGEGSRTGRGLGDCPEDKNETVENDRPRLGLGRLCRNLMGMGRGRGRGMGCGRGRGFRGGRNV